MKMVEVVMMAAPYFVFALMTGVVARMAGDEPAAVVELFKGLAGYMITVVAGLALVVFVIYPVLMTALMRRNVFRRFLKAMSPAQFLAFSTSSSAATLPVTMDCVQDNIGVSKSTASFSGRILSTCARGYCNGEGIEKCSVTTNTIANTQHCCSTRHS